MCFCNDLGRKEWFNVKISPLFVGKRHIQNLQYTVERLANLWLTSPFLFSFCSSNRVAIKCLPTQHRVATNSSRHHPLLTRLA